MNQQLKEDQHSRATLLAAAVQAAHEFLTSLADRKAAVFPYGPYNCTDLPNIGLGAEAVRCGRDFSITCQLRVEDRVICSDHGAVEVHEDLPALPDEADVAPRCRALWLIPQHV